MSDNRFRTALTLGLAAVAISAFAATASKSAKYVGSEECVTCHADTHPEIIKAHSRTAHHAAMIDATKKPDAIKAVFDGNSPIKKSDIRYVLGLAKRHQNYLDKNLKLLPGRWDAADRKWVEIEAIDGATQCVGCHVTNFDPATRKWTELGVGCEACHGPGGEHSESMEAKDIVDLRKLDKKKKDTVCGQCHSVGTDTTGKYAFPTSFLPGNDLSAHFTLKSPEKGQLNSQYNTFITSKHAEAMNCVSCHDTHGNKAKADHQLMKPVNDLCMSCHSLDMGESKAVKDIKSHQPDARPEDTCATCHMIDGTHALVSEPVGK